MKQRISVLFPVLFILLLAGCSSPAASVPASETPDLMLTESAYTPTAVLPTATSTVPAPTATSTPYVPLTATIIFDNLRLRMGPGYLFDTSELFPQNDKVKILGKEPGDLWLYVQTSNEMTGWMLIYGLQFDSGYLFEVPVITPENVMTLKGHVWAATHNPASQISVALIPGDGVDKPTEATATTNDRGEWYIYLPEDTRGEYTIAANGYGCESNIVSGNCALQGKFPAYQTVQLPVNPDLWIEFQMEQYEQ